MTTVTFDTLLATNAQRAFRAAVGILGDEQEAREATQDALLKAFKAKGQYDRQRPFYPWLYRILRNTCLDTLRRRKHAPVSGLDTERVASIGPSALDKLQSDEAVAQLRRGLQLLSEEHREILSMRHFQDLSYAEIGRLLDLPQGTVMSRLYRARKALLKAVASEAS